MTGRPSSGCINNLLHRAVYGIRCEKHEDTIVQTIEAIMARNGEMLMPGGKPPVEDFPWLKYIALLSVFGYPD